MTSQGAPEAGAWKTVPVEPMPVQLEQAASNLADEFGAEFVLANKQFALAVYAAMLAASPSPPPGVGEEIIAPAECDPNCDDPHCPYSHTPLTLRQAYENCRDRLRDAESRLAAPPAGVEVVKLEWDNLEMAGGYGTIVAVSRTPFGNYVIEKEVDDDGAYNGNIRLTLTGQVLINLQLATVEAAVSAAQADFERRVRSALAPSSLLKEAEEALRTALVAMTLAKALPGVADEYDFEPAIAEVTKALSDIGAAP